MFLSIVVALQSRQGDVRQLLSLPVFCFVLSRRMLPLISQISFIAGEMEGSYEYIRVVDSELTKCRKYRITEELVRLPDNGMVMQMRHVSFSFHKTGP